MRTEMAAFFWVGGDEILRCQDFMKICSAAQNLLYAYRWVNFGDFTR